jgi:Acetyltransferase (GNAT) domain
VLNSIQVLLNEVVAGTQPFSLEICGEGGALEGVLRPVTVAHLDDQEIVQRLTDWRNRSMEKFLSQFVATPERTRNWMRNVLLKMQGQMLFLVCVNDQVVGHYGFKNLTFSEVLLDNALRGERVGHPKLFVWAGQTLVQWLFREAAVQRVYAYVLADNAASIMMNKQIGFGGWQRYPLAKRVREGDIFWEMGPEGATSAEGRYCFKLLIEQSPCMI